MIYGEKYVKNKECKRCGGRGYLYKNAFRNFEHLGLVDNLVQCDDCLKDYLKFCQENKITPIVQEDSK